MEAPFSKTLTMALFDDKKITSVVVRDATDKSYLHEMVVPALERGYHVIMYGKK
jgi:precorrin-6x reductase